MSDEIARLRQRNDELSQGIAELERRVDASYAASEIGHLLARVAELESTLRSAVKIANEAAEEWDKAPSGMRAGKILLALAGHRRGYRPDTDAIHAALRSETKCEPT